MRPADSAILRFQMIPAVFAFDNGNRIAFFEFKLNLGVL